LPAHQRILAVIEAFYDAALDESLWPAALQQLLDLTGSQASSFWVLDGSEDPRLPTFLCINFDQKSIQEYLNGMAALDPTVRYLVAHPQQAVVHDGLLSDGRDPDSRAYYDWHERNVETRFRLVGQARISPSVQAGVALHRTRKAGRYEPRDIDRFGILHRHLQRALRIGFQVGSLRAMRQFSTDWLDGSGAAILLLDRNKRVVFANRGAQDLDAASDGLTLCAGGVALTNKAEDNNLQRLIGQALSIASPDLSAGGAMRAARPSGKRPYGIFVSPVSKQTVALSLFRPSVCIVVTDPERCTPSMVQRLQDTFGLTKAEAKLASELAAGQDLRFAAEKLFITYGTARSRLAQIFQKTETRRQGELIHLLLKTISLP
jgi:DNA-binding CsgD family transcriptional regulator